MGTQYYGPGKSRGVANGPSGTAPPGLPGHTPVAQRPHGASLTGPPAASLIPTAPQRRMSQCPDSGQGGDTVHKGLCSPGTPCWECCQAVPGLDLASVWVWSGHLQWEGVPDTANLVGVYFTEPQISARYSPLSFKLRFKIGDAV